MIMMDDSIRPKWLDMLAQTQFLETMKKRVTKKKNNNFYFSFHSYVLF